MELRLLQACFRCSLSTLIACCWPVEIHSKVVSFSFSQPSLFMHNSLYTKLQFILTSLQLVYRDGQFCTAPCFVGKIFFLCIRRSCFPFTNEKQGTIRNLVCSNSCFLAGNLSFSAERERSFSSLKTLRCAS